MKCVDASLAAKWVLVEEDSRAAIGFLTDTTAAGERLIAPPLIRPEVANSLRRAMVEGGLPQSEARSLMAKFLAFPVRIVERPEVYERALAIADQVKLRASCDATYLAPPNSKAASSGRLTAGS